MAKFPIYNSYVFFQLFYAEDFELQVLQKGHCPFCRTSSDLLLKDF